MKKINPLLLLSTVLYSYSTRCKNSYFHSFEDCAGFKAPVKDKKNPMILSIQRYNRRIYIMPFLVRFL